jgi:hypothetical protein
MDVASMYPTKESKKENFWDSTAGWIVKILLFVLAGFVVFFIVRFIIENNRQQAQQAQSVQETQNIAKAYNAGRSEGRRQVLRSLTDPDKRQVRRNATRNGGELGAVEDVDEGEEEEDMDLEMDDGDTGVPHQNAQTPRLGAQGQMPGSNMINIYFPGQSSVPEVNLMNREDCGQSAPQGTSNGRLGGMANNSFENRRRHGGRQQNRTGTPPQSTQDDEEEIWLNFPQNMQFSTRVKRSQQ